jgi:PAS domain S-box-containing protein
VSINEDITRRKSIKASLALSEKQYQELFSSMTEMFQVIELVYDSLGKVIDYYYKDINPAFEKLVGKTRKQLINKRAIDVFGIVESYWLECYQKVMETGKPMKFEDFGAALNKYYEITAWKASDKRVAIIFKDVTERRLFENNMRDTRMMLRSFIEKVPSVIIGLSSVGEIIEFNPEAEIVFGRKHSEVISKNYFELFIPKQKREKVMLEMKHLLDGDFPNQFTNHLKSANGELLQIEWTAHKLLDEKGGLNAIITIGENITDK